MWKRSLREKANVANTSARRKKKKKPGRKGVATSSTDLESHPVIKTPIWTCPAPNPVLPRAPPCPGDQAAGLLDKH